MTLWKRLKSFIKGGGEPTYIVKHTTRKAPPSRWARLRGIGWTRPNKKRLKLKRLIAKASRRRNRPHKAKKRKH